MRGQHGHCRVPHARGEHTGRPIHLTASVAYHVYEISDSPLSLAAIGLVRFLPSLGMSLIGGAYADHNQRRG